MSIIVKILLIVSIVCGLLAAKAASDSYEEVRGKKFTVQNWAIFMIVALVLLGLELLTKTWWVLFILLQVCICVLKALNKEGNKRKASWSWYSLEILCLTITAYAGWLDKGHVPSVPAVTLILASIIVPGLVGNIRVLNLDIKHKKYSGIIFLAIIALIAVIIMIATIRAFIRL